MEKNQDLALLAQGKKVLEIEAQAIWAIAEQLDSSFIEACHLVHQTKGRIAVTGLGKSGHIGKKIAATLSSTGTPAFFVHPVEALHGDLGMITSEDTVLAISNSGESEEILAMLPSLKYKKVPIIAITGKATSSLAKRARLHLNAAVDKEACTMNLAPTASTTVVLALGDALAVAVLEERGFKPEDFALSHPSGKLGRKLLMRVCDVMRSGDLLPIVNSQTKVREALLEISGKGMGMTAVVEGSGQIVGIFTDGDLRRTLDRGMDINHTVVADVMTSAPLCIDMNQRAVEAVQLMEQARVNALLVTKEEKTLVGALNMHDILRAKIL